MVFNPNQAAMPQTSAMSGMGIASPRQMMMMNHNLQNSPMDPKVSIGHMLALLDSITTDPKMNLDQKTKYISPIADAITKLIQADKAQTGPDPQQQMQLEQAKAQHEMNLKAQDQRHQHALQNNDQQHKHALEIQIQLGKARQGEEQHQQKLQNVSTQQALAVDKHEHQKALADEQMSMKKQLQEQNSQMKQDGEL